MGFWDVLNEVFGGEAKKKKRIDLDEVEDYEDLADTEFFDSEEWDNDANDIFEDENDD